MQPRDPKDHAADGNPLWLYRHARQHGVADDVEACLGRMLWLWCPGCQAQHTPRFWCAEHGGPSSGPVWDWPAGVEGPSDPLTVLGSYLVYEAPPVPRCHALINAGTWQFLTDSTHALRGQTVPLEPLPDWCVR